MPSAATLSARLAAFTTPFLRKKGVVKAAKRADKVAGEGMGGGFVGGDMKLGAAGGGNCEKDFVGERGDFGAFATHVAEAIAKSDIADVAAIGEAKLPSSRTVAEVVHELTLKIGEKISVRRFARYASAEGHVYSYLHGTKIGVLVEIVGGDKELGTDIAMHIAASNPKYLTRDEVTAELVDREKDI